MPLNLFAKDNFHIEEIIKKSNVNFLIRILSRLVGYAGVLLFLKAYGIEQFGQWTISFGIFVFARSFFGLGLRFSFVKYFASTEYNPKEIYIKGLVMLFFSTLLCSILLFMLAETLGGYLNKEFLGHSLKLFALAIVPAAITEFHAGILRGIKEIIEYSLLELAARPILIILIVSLCFFYERPFYDIYLFYFFGELVLMVISITMLYKKFPENNSLNAHITMLDILKLSFPMFVTGNINVLMKWADVLLLGFFVSDSTAGIYNIVVRLTNLILLPFQSINSIFAPKLRQTFVKEGMINVKNLFKASRTLSATFSLFPLIAFGIAGQYILGIFEVNSSEAYIALLIMASAQYFNAFVGSVAQVLNMLDQHYYLLKVSLITLVLNLVLNFILIPQFAIYGAVMSTFVSIVLLNYLSFHKVKSNLSIKLFAFR